MSNSFACPAFLQFALFPSFLGVLPSSLLQNQENDFTNSKSYYWRGLFLSAVMITLRLLEFLFYPEAWITDVGSLKLFFYLTRFSSSISSSMIVLFFHRNVCSYRKFLNSFDKKLSEPAEKMLAKIVSVSSVIFAVNDSVFAVHILIAIWSKFNSDRLHSAITSSLCFLGICLSFLLEFICVHVFHVTSFAVYSALLASFDQANADLKRCLSRTSTLSVVHLLAARGLHEKTCKRLNAAVQLLSPAFVFVLLNHSILVCFLCCSVVSCALVNNFERIGVPIAMIIYLLICIISHCHFGQRLTYKATSGLKYIYRADLAYISPECQLQLKILESFMNSKPVVFSASGFAEINYKFLVQVSGVVITYLLVMIQLRKDT